MLRLRPLHAFAATTLVAAGLHASCAVPGFDLAPEGVGQGGAGPTSSAASGMGGDGGAVCQPATYPPPPAQADSGGSDTEVVVAVRSIDFGEEGLMDGVPSPVGYDLDDRCTCQGDGHSCQLPSYAKERCDAAGGRDNAAAFLFAAAGAVGIGVSSEMLSEGNETGTWSVVLRVTNWNGLPNDDRVTVALHPSPGFPDDPCNDDDAFPTWNGNDRWAIDSGSLLGGPPSTGAGGGGGAGGGAAVDCNSTGSPGWDLDQPRFVDEGAYVTDGHVVASLPVAGLTLRDGTRSITVELTAGFIKATLTELSGGGWALSDGILVGRWRAQDILQAIPHIESPPFCTDDLPYQLVRGVVCENIDIFAGAAGPTTTCDALSFAMAFEAEPARIGAVAVETTVPPPCPPATDPANDSCDAIAMP